MEHILGRVPLRTTNLGIPLQADAIQSGWRQCPLQCVGCRTRTHYVAVGLHAIAADLVELPADRFAQYWKHWVPLVFKQLLLQCCAPSKLTPVKTVRPISLNLGSSLIKGCHHHQNFLLKPCAAFGAFFWFSLEACYIAAPHFAKLLFKHVTACISSPSLLAPTARALPPIIESIAQHTLQIECSKRKWTV